MNRNFQAKRAKYSNFCIFDKTNAIATKFCTVIKTTKFSLWVVPKFAPQIQNGGQPPFWKTFNAISLQPFDWFWWNLVWWCILALQNWWKTKNWKISKSKMADGGHLKNRKIALSQKLFGQFWRNFAWWHIWILQKLPADQKIKLLKVQDGGRPPFWKLLNAISQ